MFKGFRWYDWVIGLFTYGAWIVFKILKNFGITTKQIIIGVVGFAVVGIGGGLMYENTDGRKSERLESALLSNDLNRAEKILANNEAIKTKDGLTAAQVVEKIKANIKAEEEAQLALAKSKGYSSYTEMKAAEEKLAAESKAAETEKAAKAVETAKAAETEKAAKAKEAEIVAIKVTTLERVGGKEYAASLMTALKEMSGSSLTSETIPDQMDELSNHLEAIRKTLKLSYMDAIRQTLEVHRISSEIAKPMSKEEKKAIFVLLMQEFAGLMFGTESYEKSMEILQNIKWAFTKEGASAFSQSFSMVTMRRPQSMEKAAKSICKCSVQDVSDAIENLRSSGGDLGVAVVSVVRNNPAVSRSDAIERHILAVEAVRLNEWY
jgi:hypothetical protein